jgi:hypothetical protein
VLVAPCVFVLVVLVVAAKAALEIAATAIDAVTLAVPFVGCRLIPQRQTHKHGDTQAAEGVVCVEERFKFSPCARAERVTERIREAPLAQYGTSPVPRGEPSDGGEAVTRGYRAGLTTGAERQDALNAFAS